MIQPDTSDDVAPAEATTSSSRSYTQRAAKARSPTFAQFQQGLEDNARFSRLPLFFSVQRLHGFRQVVQHVWEHVAITINWLIKSRKGHCCSGRKSKLVEDRYIVLCTVTLIKKNRQNTQRNKDQKTAPNTNRKQTHKNTSHGCHSSSVRVNVMPWRLLFVISGILAGEMPGFRIDPCCFLHPLEWPIVILWLVSLLHISMSLHPYGTQDVIMHVSRWY